MSQFVSHKSPFAPEFSTTNRYDSLILPSMVRVYLEIEKECIKIRESSASAPDFNICLGISVTTNQFVHLRKTYGKDK